MNQEPAQRLRELVAQHGTSLCDDVRRCEALLKDYCPQHEREVFLLSCAIRQRVHHDLLVSRNGQPLEVSLAKLTRRLSEQLFLAEEGARWAVESVAVAMGVASEEEISCLRQALARAASRPPVPKLAPPAATPRPVIPTLARAANPPRSSKKRVALLVLVGLLALVATAATILIESHPPARLAWHKLLIHQRLDNDEAWGDLGDLYAAAGLRTNAQGCYEIARLLDPEESEWQEKAEHFSHILSVIRRLSIRNDAWIRSLGRKALDQGLPVITALTLFERAHSLDPSDSENLLGRRVAELRTDFKDPDTWIQMGDAVASLSDAHRAQGFYAVARLTGSDSDNLAIKAADLTTAVDALQTVGTTDVEWLTGLAATAYSWGEFSASKSLYAMAQSLDPKNPEWQRRQQALDVLGQYAQTLSYLTPKEIWISLGNAYEEMGENERGAVHYSVARLIDPSNSSLASKPASIGRAVSLLKSFGTRNDEWIGDRGDAALRLGYPAEALDIYRWALNVDPRDPEWPGKRDRLAAWERERQTVRRNPREDEYWGNLGDAYRNIGLYRQANSCYAVARLIDTDDGEWQKHQPSLASAVAMLRELGIREDEWIGDLGDVARSLGDPGAARSFYAFALELDPQDGEWRQKTGVPSPQ